MNVDSFGIKVQENADNRVVALEMMYKTHFLETLLPFWDKAVDRVHGGIYTCFSNDGRQLISQNKYTWSQGRYLWMWGRIIRLAERGILPMDTQVLREDLSRSAHFLLKHVFMENGHCAYCLSEAGQMIEDPPGAGYDNSIFADCFVVLGLSEYASLVSDQPTLEKALATFDNIRDRLQMGTPRSDPYPTPEGFTPYSFHMIMVNISQELASALAHFNHPRALELAHYCQDYVIESLALFRTKNGRMIEMLPADPADQDCLLYRHLTPGHTLEGLWFMQHAAEQLGMDVLAPCLETLRLTWQLGWDTEYGGLLRYVDHLGGKPQGRYLGNNYENLILETWDTKLWWPHSEALYSLLLFSVRANDTELFASFAKMQDYIFKTFPHPDPEVGEWIQIRDRTGAPLNKQVALPVKDPFHVVRNILAIIELLHDPQTKAVLSGMLETTSIKYY